MLVVAVALLGLIALLATLQYKWVGRISDAERDRMRASLNTRTSGFAQDFDAELTRAYLLFQADLPANESLESRLAIRYDRWQATARYPRIIKEVYLAGADSLLHRYDSSTHSLEPVAWPSVLEPIRAEIVARPDAAPLPGTFFFRTRPPAIWDSVPALLIPSPTFLINRQPGSAEMHVASGIWFTVLLMDRDYITTEMLPALAQQYFRRTGDGFDYQLAVVSTADRAVIYHSRSLIDGAHIEVEYAIADRLPPVLGDEAALRRVFQNLVANAIKYGVRGGWIGIRARQTGREVLVTIADRGIGIAPADQARIFEPFYRAPDVIAAQIQGAGLGLSLAKRIVEEHGGRVLVESAPGSGSEFTVALPAASEEPAGRATLSEPHGSRA
jgi:anti-sigma regulatory factor (Ser/Thr protein kinase)